MSSSSVTPPKFWCHQCRAQIQPTSDFACMRCGSEFIEEMENSATLGGEDDPTTFVAFDQHTTPSSDPQMSSLPFNHPPPPPFSALFAAHNTTQTQVMQPPPLPFAQQRPFNPPYAGPLAPASLDFGQLVQQVDGMLQQLGAVQPGQPYQQHQHQAAPFFGPPTTMQIFTTNGGGTAAAGLPPMMNFQSFMQNTLSALYGGQMIGNPGDYAFGSLDNIISRLMEAAGDRGPPPAAREVVDSLPSERISQEAVDAHEDCPICKDEYKTGEEALRLFCKHRFHPTCIREWLGRRNTCPVCRSELKAAADGDDTQPGGRGNDGGGGGRQHNENNAADSPSQFYL